MTCKITTDGLIANLKIAKQTLEYDYRRQLLFQVQRWIDKNPDYSISSGMGIWSLQYKGNFIDGPSTSEFHHYANHQWAYSYQNHANIKCNLLGLRESFKPVGELIQQFEAEGIYLGQNVEPQDTDETVATWGEVEEHCKRMKESE